MAVEANNIATQANADKRTYSVQEIADILQISRSMTYPDQPLDSLLANAVQNIHGEITTYEREEELEGEDQSIAADPTVRNFSYTLVNDNQLETARMEVLKPFPREEGLQAKLARLEELNTLLNMDKHEPEVIGDTEMPKEQPPARKTTELER